jgi:hypothetical protein
VASSSNIVGSFIIMDTAKEGMCSFVWIPHPHNCCLEGLQRSLQWDEISQVFCQCDVSRVTFSSKFFLLL